MNAESTKLVNGHSNTKLKWGERKKASKGSKVYGGVIEWSRLNRLFEWKILGGPWIHGKHRRIRTA